MPTLWDKRFKPAPEQTAATPETFETAADSITRLAPDGLLVPPETSETFLTTLEPRPVTTQPEVTRREEQLDALWLLATRNLISPDRAGSLVLSDLADTLVAPVQPVTAAAVGAYVLVEASRALRTADTLGTFGQAVASSAWIDEASRLILRARLAVAESRLGLSASDTLDDAALIALKDQDSPEALEALADWLRCFTPPADSIIALFDAEIRSGASIKQPLREAVGEVAERWSAEEKANLFERVAPVYHAGGAGIALLRLADPQEATSARVVATLERLFDQSRNNNARERVLWLWTVARPTSVSAQRALADKIYIPLLDKGREAIRLALKHFDLVQSITGNPRNRVKQAIQDATKDDSKLRERASTKMRDAEWSKRTWWKAG